jgi:hypothetical protein
MTADEIFRRRYPRFQVFWRTGWCRFPVYAPNAQGGWPQYQARIWAAPFIFVLWLVRGLRQRWLPARGRAVTLPDMLAHHPPGRAVCRHCRGTGIDRSGRNGKLAVRFCPKMVAAFRVQAGFRVTGSPPRWLAGQEPERLVRT